MWFFIFILILVSVFHFKSFITLLKIVKKLDDRVKYLERDIKTLIKENNYE